jgi:hypothetical protein
MAFCEVGDGNMLASEVYHWSIPPVSVLPLLIRPSAIARLVVAIVIYSVD